MPKAKTLTTKEAAEKLGLSPRRFLAFAEQQRVNPYSTLNNGGFLWSLADVKHLERSHKS